jgi:diaminohydroxyphosphoribosylaminopyrimidine deaminase/5-amino-6-(5-phosphoribosylamino)uracil reductase
VTQQAQKSDEGFMRQALRLGRFGLGNTAPNPAVGCVLVKNGQVIATGLTQRGGRPHAEAVALAEAGDAAKGATAYVTLEPCAHEGKTPPCAQALIDAGVARVVYAIDDPDKRVDGRGAELLRAADIEVESGVLSDEARCDQIGFLISKTDNRPMVTLKLALSANGFMRTPPNEDKWITGPLSRQMGHKLRAQHDAIITGSGTVRKDDPSLDCRLPGLSKASPMPVVMGKSDLPPDCKLAQRAKKQTLVHYKSETPHAALQDLAARGMTRAMLECGPTLAAAFLKDDLVDELAMFVAPHEVALAEKSDMAQMELHLDRFMLTEEKRFADDTYYHYRRLKGAA